MPYGTFTYRVQKADIVDASELSVIRKVGYDRLVLTACHPLYSAAQRIVVFARLIKRGPARAGRTTDRSPHRSHGAPAQRLGEPQCRGSRRRRPRGRTLRGRPRR